MPNRPRSFCLPEPNLTEKRYIRESGLETRIAAIVEPVAAELGYRLVRVKITPENGCTLQIMAEDQNGRFTIANCEALSKELSPVLDVEEPIDRAYHLEVSSPGVDRPLVRIADFERALGHEVRIELADMIEGRKRFRGQLEAVDTDAVTIRLPDVPEGQNPLHRLALGNIAEAKLMLTDALLEAARREQETFDPYDDPETEEVEDLNEE